MLLPTDGKVAVVRVPLAQDLRDDSPRVMLLNSLETIEEGGTFDHGAVCPSGSRIALAYTCSSLHIHNILSSAGDSEKIQHISRSIRCVPTRTSSSISVASFQIFYITRTHHRKSPDPIRRSKRLRHVAWQVLPCGYVVGAANAKHLTIYDAWESIDSNLRVLGGIKSSEPIDGWTWLSNRDRIALLAGNKVSIHDRVLSKDYEQNPSFLPSPSLGAAVEKWKRLVPLPGGDAGTAFVAVLTEPCFLQAQIRAKTEDGHGLNETLEALRTVQVQQKTKNKSKRKGMENQGGIVKDERVEEEETADKQADSGSSGSGSDAVVDLRGRIGGGGGVSASFSLLNILTGGITRPPRCTGLFLPPPPPAQQSNDDGAQLLLLKVPVASSSGPSDEQEVLRSIPVGRNVCPMPGLLAASEAHVAIGDPWSSTILVHRLSDDFPAVTSTKEKQLKMPAGLVPRGLRFFGDHTLVCLAVEAAGAKGGGSGRGRKEGGGGKGGKGGDGGEGGKRGGGRGTLQGCTSASLIEFLLEDEEPPEESKGLSTIVLNVVGLSAGVSQQQQEEQQQQQQQYDVMPFLRSFRDEMRERFDELESKMTTLERRLGEL